MTLSRNSKIGIIVTLIALVLIGILISLYVTKTRQQGAIKDPTVIIQPPVEENLVVAPLAPNPISVAQEIATQNSQQDVKIVVESFLERFGSYNNQDNFKNFSDIASFMTPTMNSWVQSSYTQKLRTEMPDFNTYFAINTKVLSSEPQIIDSLGGTATYTIATQREEINGSAKKIYYQNARINAVRINNEWKIDGVFWE